MASMSDQERVKEVIVESRIAKVLALRTDSIVMLEALDAISEFYTNSKCSPFEPSPSPPSYLFLLRSLAVAPSRTHAFVFLLFFSCEQMTSSLGKISGAI